MMMMMTMMIIIIIIIIIFYYESINDQLHSSPSLPEAGHGNGILLHVCKHGSDLSKLRYDLEAWHYIVTRSQDKEKDKAELSQSTFKNSQEHIRVAKTTPHEIP